MNNWLKRIEKALLLLCFLSSLALAVEESETPVHQLNLGQTLLLPVAGVKRVAVGNGAVMQVKVLKDTREVLIIASASGKSDLVIWKNNGKKEYHIIQVSSTKKEISGPGLRQLIKNIEGITVNKIGSRFVLDGTTATVRQHEQIKAITSGYTNVESMVFPPEFEHKKTVLLHAQFLEVKRNALDKVGIDWADLANGPVFSFLGDFSSNNVFRGTGLPTGAFATPGFQGPLPGYISGGKSYIGLSTSIASVVNLLRNSGDARLLAEPTLSCISGGSANFLAGGELPIPFKGDDGQITVTFKEFGVKLDIRPLVDEQGYIQTEVDIEVSSVDPAITVLGIPGFLTRKAATEMHAYNGQTIIMAGLFSQEGSKNVDKVPGFGDLPIVGELFKSREFRNKESELVVLVTPRIIDNQIEGKKGAALFEKLKQESDHTLKFNLMD